MKWCDICAEKSIVTRATRDAKTKMGPWANLCDACFVRVGVAGTDLGMGIVVVPHCSLCGSAMEPWGYGASRCSNPQCHDHTDRCEVCGFVRTFADYCPNQCDHPGGDPDDSGYWANDEPEVKLVEAW